MTQSISTPFAGPAPPDLSPPDTAAMAPLTAPEMVLVRDGWNKFLAYQDMLIELFCERLLHEEPDLVSRFGNALDEVPQYWMQLLERAVGQLVCPHRHAGSTGTNNAHTRSALPTVASLTQRLNDLGMQPRHWQTARRVWLWTMARMPHLEAYDHENLVKGPNSALYRFFSLYVMRPALDTGQQQTDAPLPFAEPLLDGRQRLLDSARAFVRQIAQELNWHEADYTQRWHEIKDEIDQTGTYTHTTDELTYGAMLSWRNASKCIGRISWRTMKVRDRRHVTDPDAMFQECIEHLRIVTNGGAIQSVMTVFRPKKPLERWGPRIWNSQYIRFAAYRQADGIVLGDPANLALSDALMRQGWTPPAQKTAFDVLPLAIDVPGQPVKLYEFDGSDILRVRIEHPDYPAFNDLALQWCAVPAIANFRLDIGGVQYGCVPFNGWFMETEIARDLWESDRYNQAEAIAHSFGLDTSKLSTLWRDRAFLELNVAVLHSFTKARVTIIDHQTAARQFMTHDLREKKAGRECPAQWSWVVPSAGGSTTPVWHHEMRDFYLNPSLHYAADRWAVVNDE